VTEPRRYQLQSEAANRLIPELLAAAGVPHERHKYFQQLLTTVLKLHEDGASTADLKVTNATLKELRYAYKVFAPYRDTRKVTVFGSSRTPPETEESVAAREFGRRMVEVGWMVVTGAGAGIMGAAQEGAGGERSFGLNIRLPFDQEANPWIASDPKLVTFKYFFTRKLFLVKEASAVAHFPGGFGTMDETFELLTLMQTGKSVPAPIVLLDEPGGGFWRGLVSYLDDQLIPGGYIGRDDLAFFTVTDDVDVAVETLLRFSRNFHSIRWVGARLVIRLQHAPSAAEVEAINADYADLCLTGRIEATEPLAAEVADADRLDLPRIVLTMNTAKSARLRALIDTLNSLASLPNTTPP
jgi:hypothetical protein